MLQTSSSYIKMLYIFTGWPPRNRYHQPSNHTGQNCIALSRRFQDGEFDSKKTDYYFWNDVECALPLPFVCEKKVGEYILPHLRRYPDVGLEGDLTLSQHWANVNRRKILCHAKERITKPNSILPSKLEAQNQCCSNILTESQTVDQYSRLKQQ